MLQLLIVEDEDKTRKGLRDCINWHDYGMEFCGEAVNGADALNFIRNNPVDIIITDVSMPHMDGIQLAKEIKELGLFIKVLFISGHADIPYLKSALQLDAVDYIIKPINLEELDGALKKLASVFTDDLVKKQAVTELPKLRKMLDNALPVLRERFFFNLLTGGSCDKETLVQRLSFLNISIESFKGFICMVLDFEISHDYIQRISLEQSELQNLQIEDTIRNTIASEYEAFFVYLSENKVGIILCIKAAYSYDNILQTAAQIQEISVNISSVLPTIGIGSLSTDFTALDNSHRQAVHALEQKYFLGTGQIIHINDIEKTRVSNHLYSEKLEEKIIECVRSGNTENLPAFIRDFFDMIRSSNLSLHYIQNKCLELMVMSNRVLLEQKANISDNEAPYIIWQEIFNQPTLSSTQSWLMEKLLNTAENVCNIQKSSSNTVVNLMKKMMSEKYMENITTQRVADEFCITPNYVCLLFKKETGETFNDYLTRVRLEKAKELLKDPTVKVYEVSELVGLHNQFYFSRLFKKHTGLTPSEFREQS